MAQLKDLIVTGASRFLGNIYGNLKGNADTATKATQDSAGQQINTTYIKGLSVSGKTITYTKGNGTTGTITTQDTNTTYSNATTSAAGLMSASDKSKLDGIATGANKTTVDSALSSTSTNPVQNKVVNAAINNAVHVDLNGAPAGSAVTNNADTLGGKTLAQIESQISNATTNSTSRTWTVSVPSSGWTTGSLTFMGITCTYKNVVSVAGMTSDVSIDLVKYNSGDVTAARSYICQDTGSGTVTFWAKSALATFSVKLTNVR